MKTTIFTLMTLMSLTLMPKAFASEDACQKMVEDHLQAVAQSEKDIHEIRPHSAKISSYEISLLQKNLTQRYSSLKKMINFYKDQTFACKPASLADAVAIYDFTLVGESVFADKHLRRIFKGFSKFQLYQLRDFISNYKKYTTNEFVEATMQKMAQEKVELPENVSIKKSELGYDPNLYKISDGAITGTTSVVASLAKVWGFISDRTKWREGRLKDNQKAKELMLKNLRPLDLIYETREYTLSNYTIPGHWGHVGVWLGSKEELIALGVWDKDFFKPFKEKVEAGLQIAEIRKQGINYQSLDTFINLDEIAISRVTNIQDRALEVYSELAAQIEKSYDFKFNSRSLSQITCAELVTFSYGDINWHETKTAFQFSLRPDDLALLTIERPDLSEFVLYLKGQKDSAEFLNLDLADWTGVLVKEKAKKAKASNSLITEKERKKDREDFILEYGSN